MNHQYTTLSTQRTHSLLVLHGASGLPPALVHASIQRGVCKFNVNTEVRAAAMRVVTGQWEVVRRRGMLRSHCGGGVCVLYICILLFLHK